jgi:hypothetical protein
MAASSGPLVATSRDGSLHDLQRKLDRYVGAGRIDARTDFIGARPGDPDPWFWLNPGRAMVVTLVDRESPQACIGWYSEESFPPVLDGAGDEVLIQRATLRGDARAFRLPAGVTRFGFYLCQAPRPANATLQAAAEFTTYTNRLWNTPGPSGAGAMHAPWDGDIQMLVYDVSRWVGPQTWLIACESSDSGANIGHGPDDTDNDYSDFLFTVSGVGVTPTVGATFGQLKSRFR